MTANDAVSISIPVAHDHLEAVDRLLHGPSDGHADFQTPYGDWYRVTKAGRHLTVRELPEYEERSASGPSPRPAL